jgi:hypothetical protein
MGCITSRGRVWPPKPYRRFVVRNKKIEDSKGQHREASACFAETDYVWVYPGQSGVFGIGLRAYNNGEEASPAQETAIRYLEEIQ